MAELRVNPGDWEAATAETDGPQLVVGGPGTGKTEFLVRRALYLVAEGIALPDEILLLSFSRRGSADLRRRLEEGARSSTPAMDTSTFHSYAFRVLETHGGDSLGWERMPTLLTSLEYVLLIRSLLAVENPAQWPVLFRGLLQTSTLAEEISDFLLRCNELLIGPEEIADFARDDWRALPEFLRSYRRRLQERNRIDYGTVQAAAVQALGHAPTLDRVTAGARYVLVDEYQDTTIAQARLLELLVSGGASLTVAADPYQSIYSFRGTDLANVEQFPERFSQNGRPASRLVLTTSFRTPAAILDAAARLTSGLELPGAAGPVTPASGVGSVEAVVFQQSSEEAEWVAAEIQGLHLAGLPFRDMAVFVRSKRRFLPTLSRALERLGIPHVQPDSRLSDHPAVRAVFDCVTAATSGGREADLALRRLLLGPLFRLPIGQVRGLERSRGAPPRAWPEVIAADVPDAAGLGELIADSTWATSAPAADGFWKLWETLPQFADLVVDQRRTEERAAWSSLSQVLSRLFERDRAASLADFVRWSDEESFEAQPLLDFRDQGTDRLTITTLHQSKGLEFEVVFIADAVDGVFPDLRPRESLIGTRHLSPHLPSDPAAYRRFRLQEETRLAYTAMTRAHRQVIWTATAGGTDEGLGAPSPFLHRVAPEGPVPPPDRGDHPVTQAQAEAWLRRIAANPEVTAPRRLAALHALATGPRYGLREPALFAGIQPPGPAVGLKPAVLRLSPSQADSYETCPRRYAIERRLRVREGTSSHLEFGSLIHDVLEQTERDAHENGLPHGTEAGAQAHLEARWDPARFGPSPWSEPWRRRAERVLEFVYNHWPDRPASIIDLERPLSLNIDEVAWFGRADRIEAGDGVVRIVDYKTGGRNVTDADGAASLQLGFYILAARQDPGLTGHGLPDAGELWMVAMTDRKSLRMIPFDPVNLDGVEQRLRAVAEGINSDDWPARPNEHCGRCPVRLVCPAFPEGNMAYQS